MTQVASLDSLDLAKYFVGSPCPDVAHWKELEPTHKEFAGFLDTVGAPDSVADEFPDLFHHLLDVAENIPVDRRAFYVYSLGFHFINAMDRIEKFPNTQQLKTGIPRLKKLVWSLMEFGDTSPHLSLAILAACNYEPDLGVYIARFYDA